MIRNFSVCFAIVLVVASSVAFGASSGDDAIEIKVKHTLNDLEPRVRGTIVSKGFGKKSNVAVGKFNDRQNIDAHSLVVADFYKVIVETGVEGSQPLVASMKPVCSYYQCFTFV